MGPWFRYPHVLISLVLGASASLAASAPPADCLGRAAGWIQHVGDPGPNDEFYLARARDAQVETFARIDPGFAALLGAKASDAERAAPRLPSFADTQAAIARENAKGRFAYSGADVWENASGVAVDAATFARHWAEGRIAHGGSPDAPGHQLGTLWSAFMLPRDAFRASRDKMAFLQGLLDDPVLAGNAWLRGWAMKKRDEFAVRVETGLRGLSQDIVMMASQDVTDPLWGPDRVLSMGRHLQLVTGEKEIGEIHAILRAHAAASGLSPEQMLRVSALARRFPLLDVDRSAAARSVARLVDSGLGKSTFYPQAMIEHLVRDYDPLRHPPGLIRFVPGDLVYYKGIEGRFRGFTDAGVRLEVGRAERIEPFGILDDLLIRARPGSPWTFFPSASPRRWSEIRDSGSGAYSVGRVLEYPDASTVVIEAPDGQVRELKGVKQGPSVTNFTFSPAAFSPAKNAQGPNVSFENGNSWGDALGRWHSAKGKKLETEGLGSFVRYRPAATGPLTDARLVEVSRLGAATLGTVRVALADGSEAYLSPEEIATLVPTPSRKLPSAFFAALSPARRAAVGRFTGPDRAEFPDRSVTRVGMRREDVSGVAWESFDMNGFQRALAAKAAFNASPALPVEAPLPGMFPRRYLIDEYIALPVDRWRIENLQPGMSYAWVLLSTGELRLCPRAGGDDVHVALAEGRNVLSAGTLAAEGGRITRLTVGDADAYYVGRGDATRVSREAKRSRLAFRDLTGITPEPIEAREHPEVFLTGGEGGYHLAHELQSIAARIADGKALTKAQSDRHGVFLRQWGASERRTRFFAYHPDLVGPIAQLIRGHRSFFRKWLEAGLLDDLEGRPLVHAVGADPSLRRAVLEGIWEHARESGGLDLFPWDLGNPHDAEVFRRFLQSPEPATARRAQEMLKQLSEAQGPAARSAFPGAEPR